MIIFVQIHPDKCVVLLQKAILQLPADFSVLSAYYSDSNRTESEQMPPELTLCHFRHLWQTAVSWLMPAFHLGFQLRDSHPTPSSNHQL